MPFYRSLTVIVLSIQTSFYPPNGSYLPAINKWRYVPVYFIKLKLPSLLTAWLFWTFHNKSHNMKTLVILSYSWSPFLPLTCLYGKNELLWGSVQPSEVFSREKHSPDYPCKSHDHDHQWADLVMAWLP